MGLERRSCDASPGSDEQWGLDGAGWPLWNSCGPFPDRGLKGCARPIPEYHLGNPMPYSEGREGRPEIRSGEAVSVAPPRREEGSQALSCSA